MGAINSSVWRQVAVLALVVLALYSRVADFPFVNYDDNRYFFENPQVTSGLTLESARWAFGIHGPSMWIPLTWLSHQTMVSLFGAEPAPHHALNFFLHALNACLLLLLLRRMTGEPWRAFAVAMLFAIHPLHVESVAWVTERKDVLSLCFSLLALLAYERHARSGGWKFYPLLLALHALAVMAKPLAVTLPCVMLLCDFWPLRRARAAGGQTALQKLLLEKIPLLGISAIASYLTVLCQQSIGAIGSSELFPPAIRAANAVTAYATYLRRLLLPIDLTVFYPYPKSPSMGAVVVSVLVLATALTAAWSMRRRRPAVLFGLLWFLGTLVPMIGLVQAGSAALADRYAYLPFIGLYIACVWMVFDAGLARSRAGLIAAVVFGLWLAALNWRQTGFWKSSEALFSRALVVTRANYLAHNNLGLALQDAGRIAEARKQFELSIQADPTYADARNNLAILEARQGRPAIARALLDDLLAARPDHATGWHNFGKVLAELGERDHAIAAFQQAIRLAPGFIEPRYDLACLLMAGPEKPAAIQGFMDIVKIAPGHANAWVNLGVLRDGNGDTQGAETAYQNALAAQPANGIAHLNFALIKARQRQPDEALRHMAQTAASGMDTARGRHQLGEVFRNHGDPVRARQQFEYALQLDPRNADAHNDLGVLLGAAGDHAGALAHFQQAVALAPDHPRAAKNLEYARSMLKPK